MPGPWSNRPGWLGYSPESQPTHPDLDPHMDRPSTLSLTIGPAQLLIVALACIAFGMLVSPGQGSQDAGGTTQQPVIQVPYGATADSNNKMIAVTGVDRTGSSVLYLIDTEAKQLAAYQATGGSSSMMGVKLIGARKLDLDLQLFGYNDKSDYSYRELQEQFSELNE